MKKLANLRVNLHVDGGPSLGIGHLTRMHALKEEISRLGATVSLSGESLFSSNLSGPTSSSPSRPEVAVIDLPYPADQLILEYQEKGVPTVVLDHLGKTVPDVTISVDSKFPNQRGAMHYSGLRYSIVRKSLNKQDLQTGGYALVSIGGSDLLEQSNVAAERLINIGASCIVVRGPAASEVRNPPISNVQYLRNPENFDALFAKSKFVVINGGTTLLEALHLGKSIFVLPQTKGEESFAQRMAQRGLVLGVGLQSVRQPSPRERLWARLVGPVAVDSKGASRIARIIFGEAQKYSFSI